MLSVKTAGVTLFVVLSMVAKATAHVDEAMAFKATAVCIESGKLSPADLKILADDQIFTAKNISDKVKCFVACYYKQLNLIDDKGMHKLEPTITYLNEAYEDKKPKIPAAVTKCNAAAKGMPYCDAAYKFEECMDKELM